jgi:hypothetical protein
MFFKNYFDSLADALQAKFTGHSRDGQNAADKGELSEIFIKEFLTDALSDQYKIFRGGNIISSDGKE